MKITLITVGKIKEKYLKDAIAEYSKRLSRYCKLEIIEVADEKTPDNASEPVKMVSATKKESGFSNMSRTMPTSLHLKSRENF